jgi:hypothetical protein
MSDGARLLVIERVLDEEPGRTSPTSYLADMHMMVLFEGAKERTAAEFGQLFDRTGLSLKRVVPTRLPFSVVEAVAV